MSAVRRAFGLRTVCNVSNRSLRAMGRDVIRPGVSYRAWAQPRAVLRAQAVGIHSMTRPVACRRVAGAGAGAGTNAGKRTMGMGTKALGVFLGLNITAFGGMALYLTTYSPPEHMFDELDAHEGASLVQLPNGRYLAITEYGPRDGRTLFVFHSTPGSRFDLDLAGVPPAQHAESLGLHIVCVDRPGYGLSDHHEGRTLLTFAQDVVDLADVLHIDKFAVLGFGGGGPFALACGYAIPRNHPGRLCGVGLVASEGPFLADGLPEAVKTKALQSVSQALNAFGWSTRVWLNALRVMAFAYPDECKELQRKMFLSSQMDAKLLDNIDMNQLLLGLRESLRNGVAGWYRDLELNLKEPWGFDVSDVALDTGSVWLWHGEKDGVVPVTWGWYLGENVPNCKASFPPHDGHVSLWHWRLREMLESTTRDVPTTAVAK